MKILRLIRNYFCYCGIEKEEYRELKRAAYISNFVTWRALHVLMTIGFAIMYGLTLFNKMLVMNKEIYFAMLLYSVLALLCFFFFKKDSIVAQLLIYMSISMLLLFGCFITANKPEYPAATFIVFTLMSSMFMIDKPYFMAIELCASMTVFLTWMYYVKPYEIWRMDAVNVVAFSILGIFLNVLANSIRIKEFVLARQLSIQKDTDELTGLNNKSALTRKINRFLTDPSTDKGIMFLFDIDKFKSINDTYGHDVGDSVIAQIGHFLSEHFTGDEVKGRFGGDEFVVFIKNDADPEHAARIAEEMIEGIAANVSIPETDQKVYVSVGAALYTGVEKDYSKVFKKADLALYKAKADENVRYCVDKNENA